MEEYELFVNKIKIMENETKEIEKNMKQFTIMIRNVIANNSPGNNNKQILAD
jgi:hypothetical protein